MCFLICLAVSLVFVFACGDLLRRHAGVFYAAAALAALAAAVGTARGWGLLLPGPAAALLWAPLVRGSLATALFVVVMYAGAVPDGSPLMRRVMPVRGELSILASVLTLGHNAAAGQIYFRALLTGEPVLTGAETLATAVSVVLLILLIPLFVTSFPAIRRRMDPRRWKRLQRWAYLFYGLIYVHVVLILAPAAAEGSTDALLNLAVFTCVFLGYGALRCRKALSARGGKRPVWPAAAAAVLGVLVLAAAFPRDLLPTGGNAPSQAEEETPEPGRRYRDGVFTGKGRGYAGPVWVEVTLKDDVIASVTVTDHEEDRPYWVRAEVTVDRIVEEQRVDVDNVSGATRSVKGIKKAVKDALKQAAF